jgi:hypothetical protein
MGYATILSNQKTSLKQKCKGNDCLASEYDNMFFNSTRNSTLKAGIVPFYTAFTTLKEARTISDHLPIWSVFKIN